MSIKIAPNTQALEIEFHRIMEIIHFIFLIKI